MRIFATLFVALIVAGAGLAADPAPAVEDLDWLAGHWEGPASSKGTWEARYTTAGGGLVLSANKHVVGGRIVSFEFEKFTVRDGKLIMQPYPDGEKSPIHFTLTGLDREAKRAVFENPEHDFPQILTYYRSAPDRLQIGVHAMREGRRVGFELDLKRR